MNYWPIVISAFGTLLTLAINLAIFAYFMGRMKATLEAMERRISGVEGGAGGSVSATATMVEKIAHIELACHAIPELQAQVIRMAAQFETSQVMAREARDNLQSDYHAILVAITQKAAPMPRPRQTKQ